MARNVKAPGSGEGRERCKLTASVRKHTSDGRPILANLPPLVNSTIIRPQAAAGVTSEACPA